MTTSVIENNASNVEVWGSDEDFVAVAPLGTTNPIGLTDLEAPFEGLGWLGGDGIDWADETETTDVAAHQGGVTILKLYNKVTRTLTVRCYEETALTLGLRYPGFVPAAVGTEQPTVYGGRVPKPKSDPRVFVIDLFSTSGNNHRKRYIVPKGVVVGNGTYVAKYGEASIYEFTIEVLEGDFYLYTNNPAVAPA